MKNKFKIVVIVSLVLIVNSLSVNAQDKPVSNNKEMRQADFEKIDAAKRAYFIEELKLNEKEAEKFWTIYSKYKQEERTLKNEIFNEYKGLYSSLDSLTDKEAKKKIEFIQSLQVKDIQLSSAFLSKAGEVIGYKRAVRTIELEKIFRRELMSRAGEGKSSSKHSKRQARPQSKGGSTEKK